MARRLRRRSFGGRARNSSIAIRESGEAYVFAGSHLMVLDDTGALVSGFGTNGVLSGTPILATDTVIQSSGKLVAVGSYGGGVSLVRFL